MTEDHYVIDIIKENMESVKIRYDETIMLLIHDKTCFKSLENLSCLHNSCIDNSFKNSTVISIGLCDFHKMIVTVMKITFVKEEPKLIFMTLNDMMILCLEWI